MPCHSATPLWHLCHWCRVHGHLACVALPHFFPLLSRCQRHTLPLQLMLFSFCWRQHFWASLQGLQQQQQQQSASKQRKCSKNGSESASSSQFPVMLPQQMLNQQQMQLLLQHPQHLQSLMQQQTMALQQQQVGCFCSLLDQPSISSCAFCSCLSNPRSSQETVGLFFQQTQQKLHEHLLQQLNEQLQLNIVQQSQLMQQQTVASKKQEPKQLQLQLHQLQMQQQQLIQQIQLTQRQFLMAQGLVGIPHFQAGQGKTVVQNCCIGVGPGRHMPSQGKTVYTSHTHAHRHTHTCARMCAHARADGQAKTAAHCVAVLTVQAGCGPWTSHWLGKAFHHQCRTISRLICKASTHPASLLNVHSGTHCRHLSQGRNRLLSFADS